MNENPVKKCRTCLKNSANTYPLTNDATGCKSKTTYSQLLQEYAKFEYSADYEHLLLQNICALCCNELGNAYTFIRQAQYCNNKLINLIGKQFPNKSSEQHLEKNSDKIPDLNMVHTVNNEFRIVSTSGLLTSVELDEPIETFEKKISNHAQTKSNCLNLECSSIQSNNNNTIPNVIGTGVLSNRKTSTICPICEKTVNPNNNLQMHMRIQHDITIPSKYFKIEEPVQVDYKTAKYKILEIKFNKKPKSKVVKCSSCSYTARTYTALNFHNRSKHDSNDAEFKCKFCPYTNFKKFNLFMHVKNWHKELIRALRMDAENKLNQRETFFNDTTSNSGDTSAAKVSSYCLYENERLTSNCSTFLAQDAVTFPLKISAINEIDEYKEELNDEMFIRNILNMENRQSTKSLPRRCHECGNIYNSLKSLKTHQKKVHISEDKYKVCPQCGKKFKGTGSLGVHIKNSHVSKNSTEIVKKPSKQVKEKRFMCTECSYVCTTITSLNIHTNRKHTGEKPYKCDVCFKSFTVKYNLKIHRYLHTGERPYKCPVCSKCFRCSQQLIKHKRIHNNERPYKCKECSKTFTQSYNLTLHKRIHLKEKNLNCTICDKLFETQILLNMHCINEDHHDEVD